MYVRDGNYGFLIYWSNNPCSISSFDYDKLDDLEIQSLAIFDAFQVVKVKDFYRCLTTLNKFIIFWVMLMHVYLLFSHDIISLHIR